MYEIPEMMGDFWFPRNLHGKYYPKNPGLDFRSWYLHVFLSERANWSDTDTLKTDEVSISARFLAHHLEVDEKTVRTILQRLHEMDLIQTIRASSSQSPPVYRLKKITSSARKSARKIEESSARKIEESSARKIEESSARSSAIQKKSIKKKLNTPLPPKRGKYVKKTNFQESDSTVTQMIELAEYWNSKLPNNPKVILEKLSSSKTRQGLLKKFLKQHTADDFREAVDAISESDWHTGENDNGWKADFDWLLNGKKIDGLLERSRFKQNSVKSFSLPEFDTPRR
jgi:predicted transcriptional regulator